MKNNFIAAIKGKHTDSPPVWYMRQAGRVLPEYKELRKTYTFSELLKNPKLAAEITMMPHRLLMVDACILFSDILVIPEALGMVLNFTNNGPSFKKPLLKFKNFLNVLNFRPEKLEYIYEVIRNVNAIKPKHCPLIGFAGGPLTVLCYMLEGASKRTNFEDAIKFIYKNKFTTKKVIQYILEATLEYADNQIQNGIDVFQLFETNAGYLPFNLYKELFLPSVIKISKLCKDKKIPFIYFPKGIGAGMSQITPDTCDFLSVDWQTPIEEARRMLHQDIGIQGNMDPRLLYAAQENIESELMRYIEFGSQNLNWIFNLGHGLLPDIPYENVTFLSRTIKKIDWKRK